jgi:hypothetical protein
MRNGGSEMSGREPFSADEARRVGAELGHWATSLFELEQFQRGMEVELEHGLRDMRTNVTHDDPLVTGKIALAHLHEIPDYYTRLDRMEAAASRELAARNPPG